MATPTSSSAHSHRSPATPLFKSLLKTNWKKKSNKSIPRNTFTPASSAADKTHFYSRAKQVMLLDWWLIKVTVKGSNDFKLGVGGNASDGRASIYFCSGEIVKRQDEMTLETVDGITITLASLINRSRSLENGFPSQVCNHFVLGFPFDWEEFGAQFVGEETIHAARSSKGTNMSHDDVDDAKTSLSFLYGDVPVTRVFDHMMLSSGDYNECRLTRNVFDHILSKYGSASAELNEEDTDQIITKDFLSTETGTPLLHVSEENNRPVVAKCCSLDKGITDHLEDKDDNGILDAMPLGVEFPAIHSQCTIDEDVHNLSKYVFTGRKTRSETLRKHQQEGVSSNTSTYPDTTSRTSVKQHGDTISVTNASNVSQSAIPNAQNIEVDRVDSSRAKNFSKPEHLGDDVATRKSTISDISISNEGHNFSSATLNSGLSVPFTSSKVSGSQSKVEITSTILGFADKPSQMDMEVGTLNKSAPREFKRYPNCSIGVLTRSRATLKKLGTDLKDNMAEADVPADKSHFVQISDQLPTSVAKKSKKDESSRHVTNELLEKNNGVLDMSAARRSSRIRNVKQ